jgi:hypothetical protein
MLRLSGLGTFKTIGTFGALIEFHNSRLTRGRVSWGAAAFGLQLLCLF